MTSDIRNSYLKSLWKSYPKFNFPENFIFGRFEENSSLSQFQIGEFAAEHFKSHQLVAGNVLLNGDIYVADTKQKALVVLSDARGYSVDLGFRRQFPREHNVCDTV